MPCALCYILRALLGTPLVCLLQKIGELMSGFGVTETVLALTWALLLIVPIVLAFVVSYFLIKAAVKNGVKEAVRDLDMERAAHREQ